MKLTLLQVKNSLIPQALGIPACDSRFVQYVADAEQRLCMGPEKFWNLTWKYRVAITEGIVTWPRQIASIEAIAKCGYSLPIRSEWFEFCETGYGLRDANAYCGDTDLSECRWDPQLFDRGMFPIFSDIVATGNPKKLKVYTDTAPAAGATMTVHGLDENSNPIVETMTLVFPAAVTSTNEWSRVDAVILPGTLTSRTRLYEYDTVALTQRAIGIYDGDETVPSYRRSYIGDLCDDEDTVITVLAKREFIPARNDTDILMIGNLPALKEMMLSVKRREQHEFVAAADFEAKAFELLDREASHYIGSGTMAPMRLQMAGYAPGEVANLM